MSNLQSLEDLEKWHSRNDPWGYENSDDDAKRRNILLSEIPERKYNKVLDIGCGQGFITKHLPGKKIVGVDISRNAIKFAKKNIKKRHIVFLALDLFDLPNNLEDRFDLIIITGVIYPQYIGKSNTLVYKIIEDLLLDGGVLISVHIDEWYNARFPFLLLSETYYQYKEYTHKLEVYIK